MTMIIHPDVVVDYQNEDGYSATLGRLRFLVTDWVQMDDGKMWRHALVSRVDGLIPEYRDLMLLKKLCVGDHHYAYQVFPTPEDHIDFSKLTGVEVLHLWLCEDGPQLPDMAQGGATI